MPMYRSRLPSGPVAAAQAKSPVSIKAGDWVLIAEDGTMAVLGNEMFLAAYAAGPRVVDAAKAAAGRKGGQKRAEAHKAAQAEAHKARAKGHHTANPDRPPTVRLDGMGGVTYGVIQLMDNAGRPMTVPEIRELGAFTEENAVSSRITNLEIGGRVKKAGKVMGPKGKKLWAWELTDSGRELARMIRAARAGSAPTTKTAPKGAPANDASPAGAAI